MNNSQLFQNPNPPGNPPPIPPWGGIIPGNPPPIPPAFLGINPPVYKRLMIPDSIPYKSSITSFSLK